MTPENRIQIATPSFTDEEWLALRAPIERGWLTQGPEVAAFERDFAEHHDVAHAIATTSCTTALHLMLAAGGIGPGDEVIVPSFTWIATANAVAYTGAVPVLVDVALDDYNLDPECVSRAVTDRTRAALAVHLFGYPARMDDIRDALPSGTLVFEDAACAAGTMLQGKPAGSLGDAASFSFHPRKSITTGEGGMLTTNDDDLASKAIKLRNHGAEVSEEERHQGPRPYLLPEFNVVGFNYRMTDLQAAVGRVQLTKLERFIAERDIAASTYADLLSRHEWMRLPHRPPNGRHSWQSYVVRIVGDGAHGKRNALMESLERQGISTRPGTHAIHTLGAYRHSGSSPERLPNALICAETTIALPLHNRMQESDYVRVADAIERFQA